MALKKKHKNIILLDNPEKLVSIGFNKALTISKGISYLDWMGMLNSVQIILESV